jgi:nucleotide-binding universal stress UspA family protein
MEAVSAWDGELEVASVWQPPEEGPEAYEFPPLLPRAGALAADKARRYAESGAEHARQRLEVARVHAVVLEGEAAEMLVARSEQADLLVVGSRGRGGFRGLLLGSVSQYCVTHAHCPVLVVRSEHGVPPSSSSPML